MWENPKVFFQKPMRVATAAGRINGLKGFAGENRLIAA
jgi:hypothetical protein